VEAQSPEKVSSMEKVGRYQIREAIGEGVTHRIDHGLDGVGQRVHAVGGNADLA
jgi:hypothetical protein